MTGKRQADSTPRRGYHHGDLRAALVAAGLKLLEEGNELPGLREAARAVGVSSMAVYRHFPNKHALLSAIAAEGLEMLGKAQFAAMAAEGSESMAAKFNASGRAYVRFALQHPQLYRLIFTTARGEGRLPDAATTPGRLLQESVALLVKDHGETTKRIVAARAWALVHGLAMLALDGQLDAAEMERELDRLVDVGWMRPAGVAD